MLNPKECMVIPESDDIGLSFIDIEIPSFGMPIFIFFFIFFSLVIGLIIELLADFSQIPFTFKQPSFGMPNFIFFIFFSLVIGLVTAVLEVVNSYNLQTSFQLPFTFFTSYICISMFLDSVL